MQDYPSETSLLIYRYRENFCRQISATKTGSVITTLVRQLRAIQCTTRNHPLLQLRCHLIQHHLRRHIAPVRRPRSNRHPKPPRRGFHKTELPRKIPARRIHPPTPPLNLIPGICPKPSRCSGVTKPILSVTIAAFGWHPNSACEASVHSICPNTLKPCQEGAELTTGAGATNPGSAAPCASAASAIDTFIVDRDTSETRVPKMWDCEPS